VGLTFAQVSLKSHREGVRLRVADSYTGNHPEGGFTSFKTIRRLLVVIGKRSHSGFEWETFEPKRRYPQLLLDENKLDSKSFKDKLPPNIDENLYFQRLGQYPTSVRVFDDPILFLAGLKPSWEFGQQRPAIIMGGKEPSPGFGIGSPSASVNTEPLKDVKEPEVQPTEVTLDSGESLKASVFVVHPGSVAARIKERKCKIRGGSLRPPIKRKLAFGSSSSHAVRAKTSASKDDAPFLSISDDDEGLSDCYELKDANACHLKISTITPPAWKGHLDNQMDLELLDLHDHCYARQAVVDNAVNKRAHEFLHIIKKMSGEADVIKAREMSREADVNRRNEADEWLEAVEVSLRREVKELKQDRRDIVSKVAAMKENFDLSKAKGYRSSYQKDHTQASYDFATTTFPWLDEFVADATAPIETLLSKKPPMLQKPAPSRTQFFLESYSFLCSIFKSDVSSC
ncbi:hypothetical protein Tco_0848548, partial [Tanacetum coccineum]